MRVLRLLTECIAGIDTDGVGQPHHSNRAVRQMLGEPSIDLRCSEPCFFADDDGVCGACGTNFRTRLRLLDHLSDARRTHCRRV